MKTKVNKRSKVRDDIFLAADLLASEGKMPSILEVRKMLNNTGSETTIIKYLRQWKKQLLAKNALCASCEATRKG